MKAAIYCRVSTEEQTTLNQELALMEYCSKNGLSIFEVYTDHGVSGSKTTRPALDNMLQDMRAGCFDAIIVWKLDRLGRSLQHLLQLIQEFDNRKIRLIITTMGIDTSTAMGKFFLQVTGAFAELERELIRERINAGLRRAKSQGKHCGRPSGKKDSKPRRRAGYNLRWMGVKNLPPIKQAIA